MIGFALLFHLTEQKGSRLCQTSRQCSRREPASGAYACSALPPLDFRWSQAFSLFPPAVTTVSGSASLILIALVFSGGKCHAF